MNKYLILLGVVLLASLSFAQGDNWMQYVEWRYGCAFDYNYDLWDMVIPGGCEIGDIEDWELLDDYLFENEGSMGDSLETMYYAAECEEDGGANPTEFRSAMLSFNTNNLLFKQKFLSLVRGCLTDTIECDCSEEHMMEDLAFMLSEYKGCLNDREPYCWEPGPSDTET